MGEPNFSYWLHTLDNTSKKRLRPVKKNSELHHMSRKYVWKLLHWDYWPKRSLMQIWCNSDMTKKCLAHVQSQYNLTLKRHGYAIMSEGVLGFGLSEPSCCLSIERQKTVLNVFFKSFTQAGMGGVYWSHKSAISAMSGLFLHNCITPFSPKCTNMLYRYGYLLTVPSIWILCIRILLHEVINDIWMHCTVKNMFTQRNKYL